MTERERELLEHYTKPETQKALDTIETANARPLLRQLGSNEQSPEAPKKRTRKVKP